MEFADYVGESVNGTIGKLIISFLGARVERLKLKTDKSSVHHAIRKKVTEQKKDKRDSNPHVVNRFFCKGHTYALPCPPGKISPAVIKE